MDYLRLQSPAVSQVSRHISSRVIYVIWPRWFVSSTKSALHLIRVLAIYLNHCRSLFCALPSSAVFCAVFLSICCGYHHLLFGSLEHLILLFILFYLFCIITTKLYNWLLSQATSLLQTCASFVFYLFSSFFCAFTIQIRALITQFYFAIKMGWLYIIPYLYDM